MKEWQPLRMRKCRWCGMDGHQGECDPIDVLTHENRVEGGYKATELRLDETGLSCTPNRSFAYRLGQGVQMLALGEDDDGKDT